MGSLQARTTHSITGDRRDEFVSVVQAIVPEVAGRLENLALYAALAAFWGMILYLAILAL